MEEVGFDLTGMSWNEEVGFGLTEMAWKGESQFCSDWKAWNGGGQFWLDGLDRQMSVLTCLEWLGMSEVEIKKRNAGTKARKI
jgi:hypothetical protein